MIHRKNVAFVRCVILGFIVLTIKIFGCCHTVESLNIFHLSFSSKYELDKKRLIFFEEWVEARERDIYIGKNKCKPKIKTSARSVSVVL